MKLTCSDAIDLTTAFWQWSPPAGTQEIVIDCPRAKKFVNAFLGSRINCRVTVTPPEGPVNYAGLFSMCDHLSHQPFIDTSKAISLAAMFKGNAAMRYSVHSLQTANCQDFRQMFWGCVNSSGNGVQSFDFSSARSPDAMRHFFGGGARMRTDVYDALLLSLHRQMKAGTLPTPMSEVDFGESQYSPVVADERAELVAYGWDIRDGGQVEFTPTPFERRASKSVDGRLSQPEFLSDVDTSPVVTTARGGIMVTPQHLLGVAHYAPFSGQSIRLRNGEAGEVARVDRHEMWDFVVATLRKPLRVTPAQVMPRDWRQLLPGERYPAGAAPAAVWFNARNKIGVMDYLRVTESALSARFVPPADPARQQKAIDITMGDSGSPICFVLGDSLVVGGVLAASNGSGPWVASHRQWLEEIVRKDHQTLREYDAASSR